MTSREDKINSIEKSNNQEKIIDFAKTDVDWQVRRVAAEHIHDEKILKDIVNCELTSAVAIKAMENINDIEFLSDICLNHPDAYLRLACINRISDESLLLKEKLSSLLENMLFNDPNKVIVKSVCENPNLKNQKTVVDAINYFDDLDIRRPLLRKITDEKILTDFALNSGNPFIRREAIQNPNLADFEIICEIIKNDCDELNRVIAIYKIPDSESLIELIFNESLHHRLAQIAQNTNFLSDDYFLNILDRETDEYSRQVSVSFLGDGEILDGIILNETSDKIREDAIKNPNFTNQKIMDDLILNDENPEILFEVVSRIENQELLGNFIINNLEPNDVIFKAISRIRDISLLERLSVHPDSKIRLEAVKRISQLSDVNGILRDIALTESDEKICLIAIKSMKTRNDLIEVAKNRQEKNIRISALKQIKDKKLIDNYLGSIFTHSLKDVPFIFSLKEMALNDKDGDIRKIATSKIMDKGFLEEIATGDDVNRFEAQKRLDSLFEDIKQIEHRGTLGWLIENPDKDVSSMAQATLDDLYLWGDRLSKINEIDDIDTLKDIASNDFNHFVRLEAEGKLEKILFHIRFDEIDSPANQEKLKAIACDEEFSLEIRQNALLKIIDDAFVEKFENII